MRFFLAVALLSCTAPEGTPDVEDAGFVPPDSGDPERCRSEETLCELEGGAHECVVLESDEDHCGACNVACEDGATSTRGWTCNDGECSCTTTDEPSLCDGTPTSTCCNDRAGVECFDLTTSNDHCGSCVNFCGSTRSELHDHCEAGVCVCGDLGEPCAGDLDSTCCMDEGGANARCANLLQDEADCGECGLVCQLPVGDRCRNGTCVCGAGTPEVPAEPCGETEECCPLGGKLEAECVASGSCGV